MTCIAALKAGDEDEQTALVCGSVGVRLDGGGELRRQWKQRDRLSVVRRGPRRWGEWLFLCGGVAHRCSLRPVLSAGLPSVPACDANLGQVSEGLRMMRAGVLTELESAAT
jgi:hypothetical protein